MDILQLMDEIEMRHGINEDRWGILRDILEKQAEREAAQQSQAELPPGTCPYCKGSGLGQWSNGGKIVDVKTKCLFCNGSGKVTTS